MLTAIRERITGWFAWLFVSILIIVFALWGIEAYFGNDGERNIATVNGEGIALQIYRDQLSQRQQFLAQQLGENFDINSLESEAIKQQILQSLIDNELLSQYASELGLQASDAAVQQQITLNELFFEDGIFSPERYQAVLANSRLTPQMYENLLRNSAIINQLQTGIVGTAFYTKSELNNLLAQQEQGRIAEYIEIPITNYLTDETAAAIATQDIVDYYEANKNNYVTEPRIRVEYVRLTLGEVIRGIQPDEQEIETHYEQTKGRYTNPETRQVSHILVEFNDSDDTVAEQKRALADMLVERIDAGEDFAQLAQQYSDDVGSKNQGGDLGIVARGQLEQLVEDAIYSLQVGEVSKPIRTRFGYQIIKLTALKAFDQQDLSEVRDAVEASFRQQQAEQLFPSMTEEFKNLVFEEPDSIDVTAESIGLQIETSEWFSQSNGEGVFANNLVREAAFSDDVVLENLVSTAVEVSPTEYIAVQKIDYQDSATIPLDEVRDLIVARLNAQQAEDKVRDVTEKLYAGLSLLSQSQSGWQEFLQNNGLTAKRYIGKKSQVPLGLYPFGNVLFNTAAPSSDAYQYGRVDLREGGALIFALQQIQPASVAAVSQQIRDAMTQQLTARDGLGAFTQLLAWLNDNADIVVYEDQL